MVVHHGDVETCCVCNGNKTNYSLNSIIIHSDQTTDFVKKFDEPVTCMACEGAGKVMYNAATGCFEPCWEEK